MSVACAEFERLLEGLAAEEEMLAELIDGAQRLGLALVASNYEVILRLSEEMTALAEEMDAAALRRDSVIAELGFAGLPLSAIASAAAEAGFDGLTEARNRLLIQARDLHTVQERNAALVLAAARLRDRWAGMLAGLASPTYSAGGRRNLQQGRRIVSKSA